MSRQHQQTYRVPPLMPHVEVSASTWTKDSHGLYDYEAQETAYKRQTIYLKHSCKIYRDNMRNQFIITQSQNSRVPSDNHATLVAEIVIDRSKNIPEFKLKHPLKKNTEQNQPVNTYKTSYLVVKEFTRVGGPIGFALKPGNVIKLGRVEYMVIEAKNEEETFTLRDTNHFEETNGIFEIKPKSTETADLLPLERRTTNSEGKVPEVEEATCKVCLSSEESQKNPLISPCNCKGSCQLIHVGCLRQWINSKVKKEIKGIAMSYNFTKFECEICKFPFPRIVRFETGDVEMMTISKPNKPYIVLESLCNKNENKEERCLHLISTTESAPIKIGRGHECEIRITDISVSRKHAEIKLSEGQFYIVDTNAKFGTLIKLDEDFPLTAQKSMKIQCGRSVYEFKVKEPAAEEIDTE